MRLQLLYFHVAVNRPLARHGNTVNLEDKTKEIFSSEN